MSTGREFLVALNRNLTDSTALSGSLPGNLRDAADVYSRAQVDGMLAGFDAAIAAKANAGANGDITSLSGLTTALSPAQGGTGVTSLADLLAALAAFTGDSGTGGAKGLVPAPAAGDAAAGKFLSSSGAWATPVAGTGDVAGPASSVANNLASFTNTSGKAIKDSGLSVDTDTALAANSDSRLATQKAVKAYADGLIAAQDAMVFKGVIDCSSNPNYPAADRGWTYRVSVAGKIGGASGTNVEAGDILLCLTDGTASGNQATVGTNWAIIQANLDGAVIGPASATDAAVAGFNGTTGKSIKQLTAAEVRTAAGLATSDSPQFTAINLGHASDTTLARSAAGIMTVEGLAVGMAGKQAIPIPAGAMKAQTTNGAASGTVEMSTNKNMFVTLDFDTSTQEFAQFSIAMPKSWNESTVTFQAIWSHAATTTNFGVVWQLAGVAVSDDDAGDVAFGTAQTSTDTGGTTNDIYISPESSAITIAGTPAENDMVMFQVARAPANGSDTMAIDARLHGIRLFITTNAGNDA